MEFRIFENLIKKSAGQTVWSALFNPNEYIMKKEDKNQVEEQTQEQKLERHLERLSMSPWLLVIGYVASSGLAYYLAGSTEENPFANLISAFFLISGLVGVAIKLLIKK